ncbi:MAG TPA: hypothetical protein VM238_07160 [Phycisphaerae bacterium]|nr:hypothetical protein [Phycisphaerae bacterium]
MSDDPTDLTPEIARRCAADPFLSEPPTYRHRTWPGVLQQVQGAPVLTQEQFLEATEDVEGLKRVDRLAVWQALPGRRGSPKRRAMPHEIEAACQSAGLDGAAAQWVTAAVMAAFPPQWHWMVNNETANDDWRAEYEGLRDRAGDLAADQREPAGRRKAAKRLRKLVSQYLVFGTPAKEGGWMVLCRYGPAAQKRLDKMDAVGREMQRLAVRLGLATVGQPMYVSTDAVMAETLNQRMAHEIRIVKEVAAERRGQVKHPRRAEGFSFLRGQVLYNGKDLDLPTGLPVEVLKKLHEHAGEVVAHQDLHDESTPCEASEQLRSAVKKIRAAFQEHKVPYEVVNKRGEGYVLRAN